MIKNDAQKDRTLAQIEGFRSALAQAEKLPHPKRSAAVRASYQGVIRQLEDEVREYDQLRSGALALPPVNRLDQIAPFIVKIRIAKGVSQTELARRLGVSKQVISRYEESDYQTVAIARLQEILDAIGIKTAVTLTDETPNPFAGRKVCAVRLSRGHPASLTRGQTRSRIGVESPAIA